MSLAGLGLENDCAGETQQQLQTTDSSSRQRPNGKLLNRKKVFFCGEKLLAPRPILKLESRPLSFIHGCLINVFVATFHLWGLFSIRNMRTRRATVTRDSLNVILNRLLLENMALEISDREETQSERPTRRAAR
jgi:hypothetical protein